MRPGRDTPSRLRRSVAVIRLRWHRMTHSRILRRDDEYSGIAICITDGWIIGSSSLRRRFRAIKDLLVLISTSDDMVLIVVGGRAMSARAATCAATS